ncbi:MAG: cytochrome P450 [Pseudomonadales bacterium]
MNSSVKPADTAGHNGVAIEKQVYSEPGFRSYEVYQRQRVGASTEKINGSELASADYARNPLPPLAILREHYPCYRDWINNCYWITRYDDVTSIFTDEANFATRSKRWYYGLPDFGNDLGAELPVLSAWSAATDRYAADVANQLLEGMPATGFDFATDFAARYPIMLLARILDLPEADVETFALRYWQMQQGVGWHGPTQVQGHAALQALTDYFEPLLEARRAGAGEDLISVVAQLGGSAEDLVATLLEADHQTMHGALANLWQLLLTHPDDLATIGKDRRLLKIAYLESLRYAPPVITTERFARHEVERFGTLIPKGALLRLSSLAANRDPRQFSEPDRFIADRRDLCHREARGQYRADGLPTGITFGLGPPTKHPAVPEDRPRSAFALTRDTVVTASAIVLERLSGLRLASGSTPTLRSLRVGDLYTCWELPVQYD